MRAVQRFASSVSTSLATGSRRYRIKSQTSQCSPQSRHPLTLLCQEPASRLEPVANDVGTLLANRWPARAPALYQRRTGTDQELIEFGCVRSRVYRLTGWVWRTFLPRVNRRGFFHPFLLLSLFDRSRGGDYRLIQHFKIGKSASRSEPWS